VSDSGELESMVDQVIAANAAQVEQYLAADDGKRKKLLGFFVGQVMKLSRGQANPQMVNALLAKKLV
jgi:aspartyl-tRNA(Asn)/glutamyl-tRNA(Gln) amidotransferase subunit B